MKRITIALVLCLSPVLAFSAGVVDSLVSISGCVSDYEGNPIEGCDVRLLYADFKTAYNAVTDKQGYYNLENIPKGEYLGLYAIRMDDYPQSKRVSPDEMRLEFWAWNIQLEDDLVINPKYHQLELYGTRVFETEVGYMIYTRPMSLGGFLASKESGRLDGISPLLDDVEFQVYANGELMKINSTQMVDEFIGGNRGSLKAFILQVDKFDDNSALPYIEFRIVGFGKKYGERGENLYFYKKKNYIESSKK